MPQENLTLPAGQITEASAPAGSAGRVEVHSARAARLYRGLAAPVISVLQDQGERVTSADGAEGGAPFTLGDGEKLFLAPADDDGPARATVIWHDAVAVAGVENRLTGNTDVVQGIGGAMYTTELPATPEEITINAGATEVVTETETVFLGLVQSLPAPLELLAGAGAVIGTLVAGAVAPAVPLRLVDGLRLRNAGLTNVTTIVLYR